MSLIVVKCDEPSITCFYNTIKIDGFRNISSLEQARQRRSNSLVLAHVIKVISVVITNKRIVVLLMEVLPNYEHGEQFKAVIEGDLALQVITFSPQNGDKFAFFEPFIFYNTSYQFEGMFGNEKQTKYLLQIGLGSPALMWCSKEQTLTKVPKQTIFSANDCHMSSDSSLAPCFKTKAFLLDISPDPFGNPLDLVSGYCHIGCHKMFLFSRILWRSNGLPLCPECFKTGKEIVLKLMLILELHVLCVPSGRHTTVLAMSDNAEKLMDCSMSEFVRDAAVRKSRVKRLKDHMIHETIQCGSTPLLQLTVANVYGMMCLIDL